MTIGEIKKLLDRGDYIKIARIAGYKNVRAGSHYVYDVMNGRRNSNKGKGKKIKPTFSSKFILSYLSTKVSLNNSLYF
jgi:hypothetical protein